jgi:miniconductance mechanosensitive channel
VMEALRSWLAGLGLGLDRTAYLLEATGIVLIAAASYLANWIARKIIVRAVHKIAARTVGSWDDVFARRRVFERLSHFAPALVIYSMAPLVLENPVALTLVRKGVDLYVTIVALLVFSAALDAANEIYQRYEIARRIPIRGYLQLVKLIVAMAGGILIFSMIFEKSPWVFLSGLGAMTAVLLLIFKDTLLGFVAGIQLVANDMVRPGDWIEMPKYGADGDVLEITLNTVKVQNWDKTVTTIPTYALISDSFKNWRGMQESGGRRIKRAVYIDVNSIRFCTPEMLQKFSKVMRLRDYLTRKLKELDEYNRAHGIDDSVSVNGRRMTNIGVFRAYLAEYLRHHPKIQQSMTLMVRQLEPAEKGLPLEVYAFSNDLAWVNYEAIQADIFDHIFAVLPFFGLRPFQEPGGADIGAGVAGLRELSQKAEPHTREELPVTR